MTVVESTHASLHDQLSKAVDGKHKISVLPSACLVECGTAVRNLQFTGVHIPGQLSKTAITPADIVIKSGLFRQVQSCCSNEREFGFGE